MKTRTQEEKIFKENMEQLAKTHERSKVYVDFMDYYIYQNSNSTEKTLPTGYKPEERSTWIEECKNYKEKQI